MIGQVSELTDIDAGHRAACGLPGMMVDVRGGAPRGFLAVLDFAERGVSLQERLRGRECREGRQQVGDARHPDYRR